MTKRIGTGELSVVSRMMAARARGESSSSQQAAKTLPPPVRALPRAGVWRRLRSSTALRPARAAQGERLRASGSGRAAQGERE